MKMENSILEEVLEWLSEYEPEEQKQALEDLQEHGCISGMVGSLIYYDDTTSFLS